MAYTFTTIAFPSDTFTQALGINSTDTIVGFHGATTNLAYSLVLPATFTSVTTPANLLTIPPPSIPLVPTQTDAVGINDAQQIVGFVTDNQTPAVTRGFIDNGGVFSLVVAPGTAFNQLLGDNNVGQDVGYSSLDVTGATLQLAYIYQQTTGTFTYLDNATHTADLPDNVNSQATGIDNAGDVVGFYLPTATTSDGFLIKSGTTTPITLQFPGSTFTQALGINDEGQVVGFYNDAEGVTHGFIWSNGNWTSVDAPGASATTINGINDAGHMVGFDTVGTATDGFEVNLPLAQVTDTSTMTKWQQALTPYTGPVSYLTSEFIDITSHNLNILSTTANVFLHSGPGEDALQVTSGQNVLDGGTGSNFLTDGSGADTDFVDARGATASIWSTMNNFHSGDSATMWGITAQDFTGWVNGQGATGFTGLTTHILVAGGVTASLTLAGYSTADLSNGRLSVSFGTDPASGSAYLYVHANS
jgi:probable HAF family extracellular repeat protein